MIANGETFISSRQHLIQKEEYENIPTNFMKINKYTELTETNTLSTSSSTGQTPRSYTGLDCNWC